MHNQVGWSVFLVLYPGQRYTCVCIHACFPYCSSCLWYIWHSIHTLGAHACSLITLCLLFAVVGQASARYHCFLDLDFVTHRLVLLCVVAHCFIFWNLPGYVLAAPELALCGWIGVNTSTTTTTLSLSLSAYPKIFRFISWQRQGSACARSMAQDTPYAAKREGS